MSWSRLSCRIILHRSKNLGHFSHEPRFVLPNVLSPRYFLIQASTESRQYSHHDAWGLVPRRGLSIGSFNKSFGFRPYKPQCISRSPSLLGFKRHYASQALMEKKSRKMLLCLTALVFAMAGLTYAAVPLYRRFCQATGYGGTIQRREVGHYSYWDRYKTFLNRKLLHEKGQAELKKGGKRR